MDESIMSQRMPTFEFRCDVHWDAMALVDGGADVRRCNRCEHTVHLCHDARDFYRHAEEGHCVAVYETGDFERTMTSREPPFDPFEPSDPSEPADSHDSVRPSGPSRPETSPRYDLPLHMPTAGMPRKRDVDDGPITPPPTPIKSPSLD